LFFISFEGCEGTGKTTQIEILKNTLEEHSFEVITIQEPGTTKLGLKIRKLLKGAPDESGNLSEITELFMFSAARSDLIYNKLNQLIQSNKIVICDRYVDSTTAYQGYGRQLDLNQIELINNLATQNIMPDITFLLDFNPKIGIERLGSYQMGFNLNESQGQRETEGVRFETESNEFLNRVRNGYLKLAKNEPNRWKVINADLNKTEISKMIWETIESKLENI